MNTQQNHRHLLQLWLAMREANDEHLPYCRVETHTVRNPTPEAVAACRFYLAPAQPPLANAVH